LVIKLKAVAPPQLEIVSWSCPDTVNPNQQFEVSATVHNKGAETVYFRLNFIQDGRVKAYTSGNLDPCTPRTWKTDNYVAPSSGTTLVRVEVRDKDDIVRDYKEKTVTVSPPPPAKGQITAWSKPSEAREGEKVSWTVTVKNIGGSEGYFQVYHEATGVATGTTQWFKLSPGQTMNCPWSFTMPNRDVSCKVELRRKTDTGYVVDDQKTNTIHLTTAPPEKPAIPLTPIITIAGLIALTAGIWHFSK